MPETLFFPYLGPNRRSDKRVVELHLNFSSGDEREFPKQVSDIRHLLLEAGILDHKEHFPAQPVQTERMSFFTSG